MNKLIGCRPEDVTISSAKLLDLREPSARKACITYVGVGVSLRESDGELEVLLVQEAKAKCYGKWYVPAGRIDPNETILEGVIREVFEETGIHVEIEELLSVQIKSVWHRFVFLCNPVGGNLKNVPDAESLLSSWVSLESLKMGKLELRSDDFLILLHEAINYRLTRRNSNIQRFLPTVSRSTGIQIEMFVLHSSGSETEIIVNRKLPDIYSSEMICNALPVVKTDYGNHIMSVISPFFQKLFHNELNLMEKPNQLTLLECRRYSLSQFENGIRMRVICMHRIGYARAEIRIPQEFQWIEISKDLCAQLYLENDQYRPSLHISGN